MDHGSVIPTHERDSPYVAVRGCRGVALYCDDEAEKSLYGVLNQRYR